MPTARMISAAGSSWGLRFAGAALCLGVTVIHLLDQGGIPGSKSPAYVADGYYLLEIAGVVAAFALIAGARRAGWFLSAGVAAGPFIGYVLSRGPGLPGYTDDVGNWTEPLGLIALFVEAVLFALAATVLVRGIRPARPEPARIAPDGTGWPLAGTVTEAEAEAANRR